MKKGIAIVPGSFDPITCGHMDIVKRAADMYGTVYLAVMINPEKSYMFDIQQRVNIAKAAVSGLDGVQVISSEGMLWELARSLGADAIVKGYRNEQDLEYERSMAEYNRDRYPLARTVLLEADDSLSSVSSTAVRERILRRESLLGLVPSRAIDEIYKIIPQQI